VQYAGLPLPGVRLKVVDDETGAEVLWDGESLGELWMKGPWVTTEYFNAPEKTRESITEDGWLRTGDVARVTKNGYTDVVDRLDDLVKSGGEWISSLEVENRLMGHEAVQEAAVVPVEHETWDERPVAFVVVADGVEAGDDLSETLREHVGAEYPSWWIPDVIEFIEEILKGSTGKFSKNDPNGSTSTTRSGRAFARRRPASGSRRKTLRYRSRNPPGRTVGVGFVPAPTTGRSCRPRLRGRPPRGCCPAGRTRRPTGARHRCQTAPLAARRALLDGVAGESLGEFGLVPGVPAVGRHLHFRDAARPGVCGPATCFRPSSRSLTAHSLATVETGPVPCQPRFSQ